MADERIKIRDGELLDAIKGQENTDTRVSIPMGEILDAIKANSGGSTGDSLWEVTTSNDLKPKDGHGVDVGSKYLKNVANGASATDGVNKGQLDLKPNKISMSYWTKLDLGAVPWEETNPELQIINKFCGMNARVKSDGVEIEWPNDDYFELKELNNTENKKLATSAVLYGTNELYLDQVTISFNFDDTLSPTIRTLGKSGWGGYVQTLIDEKADKSYVDSQVKIPNDKNTEQDTRLTNDETILNGLTTTKADKSYVDDSDSSIRTQHSSDFTLLQNQVGSKTDKSYVDTADAKKQDKLTAQTLLAFFEAGDGITIALDGSKIKISKAA